MEVIDKNNEFQKWLGINLESIPQSEPVVDDLTEIVNMFKEKFDFTKITRSNSGTSVWNFRMSYEMEVDDGTWYSNKKMPAYWKKHANLEIRIWKQKDKVRMGLVSSSYHNHAWTSADRQYSEIKKMSYYNGDPRFFLEEVTRRFATSNTSKKFGL